MRVELLEASVPSGPTTGQGGLFHAANYPIFRVNLAPATSLLTAGHQEDAELLREVAALRRTQTDTAQGVADALYRMAPHVDDATRRSLVLPLRRSVHNQRLTRGDLDVALLGQLPGSGDVRAWVARQHLVVRLEDELRQRHTDRLHAEREELRRLLTRDTVTRSLAMSSQLLPAAAHRYCSRPWDELDRRGRKSEQHLLRYGLRAGTKTSPFSQYTVVGYPHDIGGSPAEVASVVSSISLNSAYVRRLEAALRRLPGTAERYVVHPTVGLRQVEGRLVATGQRDALGSAAAEIADRYGEAQVSIPASPVVLAVLAWLRQQPGGEAPVGAVVDTLATQCKGLGRADALRLVEHLQDCGILTCKQVVHEQSTDPLRDLCGWVGQVAESAVSAPLTRAAAHLASMVEVQDDLAGAGAGERVRLLRFGETRAAELLALVGEDGSGRPLPSPLWYEDSRLAGATPDAHGEWAGTFGQVGRLLDLIHVFDEQHVFMRVLRHRFVERFGPGGRTSDLDELARLYLPAYDDALQINEGLPHRLLDEDPVLAGLVELRARLLGPVRDRLLIADADDDVHLPAEWSSQVAAELPPWCAQRPASYAVFLQPRGSTAHEGAVLNKIYNGWGNYVSRFLTHAPVHVLETVRAAIATQFPPTEVVAEFRPVNGFNANVHPLLTPFEIDVSGRPETGQIALDALDVRHNAASDRIELVHRATGVQVNPLYLGFLIPYYLPSRLVPLTAMAGNGSIMFEPQVSADRSAGVDRGRIRSYPRVVWEDLVVARRRWVVPSSQVPTPDPGESDADFYVRFNAWRLAAGLPDEVFLHPPAPELEPGLVNDYFSAYLSNRKPQYVATTGRLHCLHLKRLLVEQPGVDIVFEEALPAPGDALEVAGDRRTTELVVDFYRSAGPTQESTR